MYVVWCVCGVVWCGVCFYVCVCTPLSYAHFSLQQLLTAHAEYLDLHLTEHIIHTWIYTPRNAKHNTDLPYIQASLQNALILT